MQDHELTAWLGPAATELTPEQTEHVADAARLIHEHYPDSDQSNERDAALSAVVQHLLGETTPEEIRSALSAAIMAQAVARAAAIGMAVAMVRADGTPKAVAARLAGVDRMALLEVLGERERRRQRA